MPWLSESSPAQPGWRVIVICHFPVAGVFNPVAHFRVRKNTSLEIVTKEDRSNTAEELIHIHMGPDPVLQLHIRKDLRISVLTIRKNRNEHIPVSNFPGIRICDRYFRPRPVNLSEHFLNKSFFRLKLVSSTFPIEIFGFF